MALIGAGRLALALSLGLAAAAGAAEIRFVAAGPATVVEVRDVEPALLAALRADPSRWNQLLAVYTLEADASDGRLPALLGSYALADRGVRFEPRFPLVPGQTYVARWRPGGSVEPRAATFTVPRPELEPTTRLAAVYPSGDLVPENLLRVYLQFSAPMSRGRAGEHVRLLDESGVVVEGPFVAPERELWSPDRTRLTLFFDPGRIKRGVGPNVEVGPPLERGRTYTLVVDRALTDARGVPLVGDYRKRFSVGAPDREQPRTADWILEAPAAERDPVTLRFPEALDRGLLDGLLEVLDSAGEVVAGETVIPAGERAWRFVPAAAWGEGVYRVRVGTDLEDLAGNSLRRPFEVALDGAGDAPGEERFVDLPFRPGG